MTETNLRWPELKYENWRESCQTLHRWLQIVGKIRLSKTPWINHAWNSTLSVTERGLTTSVIHDERESFSIEFDFVTHSLRIRVSDGKLASLPLQSEPVASFYARCMGALQELGISAHIHGKPNELPDDLPFAKDTLHRVYDPEYVNRFWKILLHGDRLMKEFRSHFVGKSSPVHFFWGSMDLAVTRFSGRRAPEHPGGAPHLPDLITRESYSREVSSCGFWPGGELYPTAAFYSYAYPKPEGFESTEMPNECFFDEKLREFILPYERVRTAADSDRLVLSFFQKAYEAAANLSGWDRELLEEDPYLRALQARQSIRFGAERKAA